MIGLDGYAAALKAQAPRAFVVYDSESDQITRYEGKRGDLRRTHQGQLEADPSLSWADAIRQFLLNAPMEFAL